MTLASAHHATPAFNGLLYATVATVIPVLYLAITLQSTLYTRLLQVPDKAMRWLLTRTWIRPQSLTAELIAGCIMTPVLIAAWFILLYGIAGEIIAIVGLVSQSTSKTTEQLAAFAVILLTLVVGAPPATALLVTFGRFFFGKSWSRQSVAAESEQGEQQDTEPQPTASIGSKSKHPEAGQPTAPAGG
jgi:hypothetical protein